MESEATRAAFERLTSGTKRVLLVEGHTWFREALAYLLNLDPGLIVVQQADSLDELRDDTLVYDAIVADFGTLGRWDSHLLSRLRECSSRAPLLALVGSPDIELHLRALESGADMLLPKSVSVSEIVHSVKLLATSNSATEHPRRGRS